MAEEHSYLSRLRTIHGSMGTGQQRAGEAEFFDATRKTVVRSRARVYSLLTRWVEVRGRWSRSLESSRLCGGLVSALGRPQRTSRHLSA